jgi:hypothetical protein
MVTKKCTLGDADVGLAEIQLCICNSCVRQREWARYETETEEAEELDIKIRDRFVREKRLHGVGTFVW